MDKIVKLRLLFSVLCLSVALSSCKYIEHIFLINNTSETIHIQVTLVTREGEQTMETDIAPNESDGWEFEVDKGDKKVVDKKLKGIVIIDATGCKRKLEKKDISSLAEKSGAWNIVIDEAVLGCN